MHQLANATGGSSRAKLQAFASVKSLYNTSVRRNLIASHKRAKDLERAKSLKLIQKTLSNEEVGEFHSMSDKVCLSRNLLAFCNFLLPQFSDSNIFSANLRWISWPRVLDRLRIDLNPSITSYGSLIMTIHLPRT